jgi:hypothetical protein
MLKIHSSWSIFKLSLNEFEVFLGGGVHRKASGEKCKLNLMVVSRPTSLGGLVIFDMDKFATTLRLRWSWLAWMFADKTCVGTEIPCNNDYMELFYSLTRVTIGFSNKARFWNDTSVDGLSPKCIVPYSFAISRRINWSIQNTTSNDTWIHHFDVLAGLLVQNLHEFTNLW